MTKANTIKTSALLVSIVLALAWGASPLAARGACWNCLPAHGSSRDRFVIARFKKVARCRYDVTYLVIQCPGGKVVSTRTCRNRIVLPRDAVDDIVVNTCPPELLYLDNHAYLKRIYFERSILDDYFRHLLRHFDIRRDAHGHMIYRGPLGEKKPTYVRMRLDQLCR